MSVTVRWLKNRCFRVCAQPRTLRNHTKCALLGSPGLGTRSGCGGVGPSISSNATGYFLSHSNVNFVSLHQNGLAGMASLSTDLSQAHQRAVHSPRWLSGPGCMTWLLLTCQSLVPIDPFLATARVTLCSSSILPHTQMRPPYGYELPTALLPTFLLIAEWMTPPDEVSSHTEFNLQAIIICFCHMWKLT